MKYKDIYDNLINRARNRILPLLVVEQHHIIPRCMNGTDEITNLVYLTPEEHYTAHQLLVKIYPNNNSLIYAAHMMGGTRKGNKIYGWLKRKYSLIRQGNPTHIIPHTDAAKRKISESVSLSMTEERRNTQSLRMSGRKLTEEHKIKIGKKSKLKTNSDETRKKISESNKGKVISEEARRKSSLTQSGRKQELLKCTNCSKEGGRSNMLRYHFNNCKAKDVN